MPDHFYSGVAQHTYTFDKNANVTRIEDTSPGTVDPKTRTMAYDSLDRLVGANSTGTGMWGTGTYSYDALDNIVASTVGSRDSVHADRKSVV